MATEIKVTLVPGDGIGPEVTHEAVLILEAISQWSGSVFHFTEKPIGGVAIRAQGSPLPPATLEAALDSDAVLLGAVGGNEFNLLPPDKRPEAGLLQLRQALGGFANLRPVRCVCTAKQQFPVCVQKSPTAPTFCLCANCWVVCTSARRVRGIARRCCTQHHGSTAREEVSPRRAHRI